MKTYQTNTYPSQHDLYLSLSGKLPEMFNSKIAGRAPLYIIENDNSIEIGLPAPYEEYLYKVEVDQDRVNISKSEHYTDDVNSLALEDILTDVVIAFIGKENIVEITPSTN